MTVRFTLIACGATRATRSAAFPLDEPLEETAAAQAAAMAGEIGEADSVWCSPALSAWQTAEALGLAAEADPRLADLDVGRWAGKGPEELMQAEPQALATWITDPAAAPHGGESVVDLVRRIGGWLDEQGRHTGRGIVITHAACICAAVIHCLKVTPEAFWRIDIAPLSFTSLSARDGQWRLRAAGSRFKDSAIADL
jgi:broad specificity phosphatase PhoE